MRLGPAPKKYTKDGHRITDPATTLKRVEPLCRVAGITRVADITGLDRVGIPVFSSIRPIAETGAVTVYNGKGATKDQAKVSAIMEGLERYCAEVRDRRTIRDSVDSLLASVNAVDPRDLILPKRTEMHIMYQPVAWVEGIELNEMEKVLVPASAVFHPYSSSRDLQLFRTNTNGLASGNSMEEAVLHGLCEVIERDAWSICEARRKAKADLIMGSHMGVPSDLMDKFVSSGIEIHLKDLTSDIGIPTFGAAADDVQTRDPILLTMGIGTHLSPEVVVIRALTEVAQSRLTQIHGAREDTVKAKGRERLGYDRVKMMNKMWFSDSDIERDVGSVSGQDTLDIYEDIQIVLSRLKERGFKRAIAVDLTREELGIPVVRIVVPGMEVFSMDDERVGPRLLGGWA
ncbi:MAG: YcaO-related McrA-glycine thioamidation protein [Methanomassiliicoccales archaeon]|nr:YcaO-related McrA-glycine thioamidation protein [Methanomassiliicoccales archaeon]